MSDDTIKISSTRLAVWLDCRRKWYFQEVRDNPVAPNEAMDFGSVFHALVEYRMERGAWPPLCELDAMNGNYEDPIDVIYRRGDELYHRAKKRAKVAWTWFQNELDVNLANLEPEVPVESFGFEMCGFPLSGWFDALDRRNKTIYDWKTRGSFSYAPQTAQDFRGDVQLCYYAACARKAFGWDSVTVKHLNVMREDDDHHFVGSAELPAWYLDEVWGVLQEEASEMRQAVDADDWSEIEKNPTKCFKYGKPCRFYGKPCPGDEQEDDNSTNEAGGFFSVLSEDAMNPNSSTAPDDEQPVPFPEKDVGKLGVNVRAERNLREAGFETFSDVDEVSDQRLLEVSYVGKKTVESIRETLDSFRPGDE